MKASSDNRSSRLIRFLIVIWFIKIIVALFIGLGWFFILQTLERFIIAFPLLYNRMVKLLIGKEWVEDENETLELKKVRIMYGWRLIIALLWLGMTIIVFLKANISIIKIIEILIR